MKISKLRWTEGLRKADLQTEGGKSQYYRGEIYSLGIWL